jgi:hypothetical protein
MVPRICLALTVAVVSIALGAGLAPAGAAKVQPKKGTYSGNTKQSNVLKSARAIAFKVKGKKITLTTEPVVAKGLCVSPPVFLIDPGQTVSTKIKGGRFSFSATHVGSKINRIKGTFTSTETIEGEITYYFDDSATDLCQAGKKKTTFEIKRR